MSARVPESERPTISAQRRSEGICHVLLLPLALETRTVVALLCGPLVGIVVHLAGLAGPQDRTHILRSRRRRAP